MSVLFLPLISRAGERELWFFWNRQVKEADHHAEILKTCQAYAEKFPDDPFLPVVRSIEAWHLLRQGKQEEALERLKPHLDGGPSGLERGLQRVARSWVTRIQQDRLEDALQYYYKKEVRYPDRLDQLLSYPGLPNANRLSPKDAWNVSWSYRLVGFKGVPGFRDQKYELKSHSMTELWDTQEALQVPYASRIQVQPIRSSGAGAQSLGVLRLELMDGPKKGQKIIGQVGEEAEGLTIAHAGKDLVILCDTLHWKIVLWKK